MGFESKSKKVPMGEALNKQGVMIKIQIDLHLCLWTTYFENRYSNFTTVDRKIWKFFEKKTVDTLI